MIAFDLSQEFNFEAAHTLTRTVPLAEYEPSTRVHGHSYLAKVVLTGSRGANGMLEFFKLPKNKKQTVDLYYLRKEIEQVRVLLDHRLLDDVDGLGAPTLENLGFFIFDRLSKTLPVSAVSVRRPTGGDECVCRSVK